MPGRIASRTNLRAAVPLLLALALLGDGRFAAGADEPRAGQAPGAPYRNPRWALRIEQPGLPNFYEVSPALYRGAQPTREGLDELRRIGVKTVVSLRAFHGERGAVAAAGFAYERISFKVWHPEDEDLRRFLAIVTDPARQPVFVHCLRGADRTGTAVAVYRVCAQRWSREDAIDEMVNGGFEFHPGFRNLVAYLRSFDAAAVSAGLKAPPDPVALPARE
jgi:protein tyrosine phosphatase (PTP) superfamily phosphohydrolase (DUF442 family)